MKRFKTVEDLRNALNTYPNNMIMKTGNNINEWYYADYYSFKPLFYYLTEEEMNEKES